MKDKKAEQETDRKRHRERLKAGRTAEPNLERHAPALNIKPTILIVCEGKNTEPSYFKQFRLSSAKVIPVGEGYNTLSLVNRAIELQKEGKYEQVWCVFDADPKPDNLSQSPNFNNAIALAKSKKFGVAYSNQAFEYWLLLHLSDHQGGAMPRSDYDATINKLLKPFQLVYDGKGSKKVTTAMFELLEGIDEKTGKKRISLAIERAKRNYNTLDHTDPAAEESSTTVFKLVEELLKYI